MALTIEEIELIYTALRDQLTESQQKDFNSKINDSEEFKIEYETQRNIMNYLKAQQKIELKNELKKLYSSSKKTKSTTSFTSYLMAYKYGIAATIALIVCVSLFIFNSGKDNFDSLYLEYYEPYAGVPLLRGSDQDSLQIALSKYYNHNFEEALLIFKEIETPNRDLLIGNCYLNLSKLTEAKKAFENAIESKKGNTNAAKWYLALTYMKEENVQQSLLLLSELQNSEYGELAKKLLEDIK
ncbi:MAG: hypothetical protein RIB54_07495 [Fulvivirga sp.]|uniref:hypothetical protein n=2 Tax=Fulvivirga sp. TaxID=1931237 RepID=UPI0032EEF1FD